MARVSTSSRRRSARKTRPASDPPRAALVRGPGGRARRSLLVAGLLAVVALVALGVALALRGSVDTEAAETRPLSEGESERLAAFRFRNYLAEGSEFTLQIPQPQGDLDIRGRVDFREHVGIARTRLGGERALIWWNGERLEAWPGEGGEGEIPSTLPATGHTGRAIDARTSTLDRMLLLLLQLAQDRPDNSTLLLQSDARWVGTDTVNDVRCDIFAGPSTTTAAETAPQTPASSPAPLDASPSPLATRSSAGSVPPERRPRYCVDATGILHSVVVPSDGGSARVVLETHAKVTVPRTVQ